MTLIHGRKVFGFIDDVLVFCGTDLTFSEDTEMIEASTVTSGVWREFRPRKSGWSIDIGGFTKVDSTDGQVDYFTIISLSNSRNVFNVSVVAEDEEGNSVTISGNVYKKNSSLGGPVKAFAPALVSFQGTGAYELSIDGSGGGGACDPVTVDSFDFPDATVGDVYAFTIPLGGDSPFARGAGIPTKPSWMIIDSSGANISGTPAIGNIGVGITISYNIENCDGANSVSINKTINVGKNVFVINNSSFAVVLQNSAGDVYTFGAANADDDNIIMTSSVASITTVGGTTGINNIGFEFLTTLPSTSVNSGTVNGGDTATSSDLSITNYLRFTD